MSDALKIKQDIDGVANALQGNPEVVAKLKEFLRMAEAGQLDGLAIVGASGSGGLAVSSAGGLVPQLIVGLEKIKSMLVEAQFAPKRSGILMPQRRM
jgi:hypothetical protein